MPTQRTRRQSVAALQGKQHVSGKAGGPGTVAPEGVETGTDSDDDSLEAYGLSEGEDEGASRFTKYICGAHPWLQLLKIDMHTPSSMRGLMSCHHLVGRVCHWTLRAVHCQHVSTYEAIKGRGNDSNVPGLLELLLGFVTLSASMIVRASPCYRAAAIAASAASCPWQIFIVASAGSVVLLEEELKMPATLGSRCTISRVLCVPRWPLCGGSRASRTTRLRRSL